MSQKINCEIPTSTSTYLKEPVLKDHLQKKNEYETLIKHFLKMIKFCNVSSKLIIQSDLKSNLTKKRMEKVYKKINK